MWRTLLRYALLLISKTVMRVGGIDSVFLNTFANVCNLNCNWFSLSFLSVLEFKTIAQANFKKGFDALIFLLNGRDKVNKKTILGWKWNKEKNLSVRWRIWDLVASKRCIEVRNSHFSDTIFYEVQNPPSFIGVHTNAHAITLLTFLHPFTFSLFHLGYTEIGRTTYW